MFALPKTSGLRDVKGLTLFLCEQAGLHFLAPTQALNASDNLFLNTEK